jgi:hypothetical protein
MIKKETIQKYFEEELENIGRLTILLYSDKKLLNEGDYYSFANEILSRSKKAYIGTVLMMAMFSVLGVIHFYDLVLAPGSLFLGLLYLIGAFLGLHFATKEYYKISGSMKFLGSHTISGE